MTDEQLEALLPQTEADWVERKESAAKGDPGDRIRQAICAFSNDYGRHGRGVLFVGATDDGIPTHLLVDDAILLTLTGIRTEGKILPQPSLRVERRTLLGADMAVVFVEPSHYPPVRLGGRCWIRVGPRRDIASDAEERQLAERRVSFNLPFDLAPIPMAGLDDLDRLLFEQTYLPAVFSVEVLEDDARTFIQRLHVLKLAYGGEDPSPTVLGLLTIGKDPAASVPGAYVQFMRIRGREWGGEILDQAEVHGPVPQLMQRLDDLLRVQIASATDIVSADREQQSPAYPLAALQQLVRNAVMHRDYAGSNAPVRLTWYDDRVEIQNPGGPFGTVTQENFGRPGVSDYRNPNLAAVMKELGYVQRFGYGIATARRILEAEDLPAPEFNVEASHVQVVVRSKL